MGKSANAGGGQPKAKAKASSADRGKEAKDAKDAKDSKDAKETTKADAAAAAAADASAKLLEEAKQKLADDQRDEKIRVELRESNRKARDGGRHFGGNRDKGIARVTKFQNKLKLFKGDVELASVTNDIDGVDASRYVSELAECIMEAAGVTLKLKELFACVKVCSRLHATYEDFGALLAKALEKAYSATLATDVGRRRFLLRLCAELFLVECVPKGTQTLLEMVKELSDISLAEEQVITNFTIVSSLVQKHATSCFSVVPTKQKAYEEALGSPWVERQCLLDSSLQAQLLQHVVNAYQGSAGGLLQAAMTRLLEQEKVNAKLRIDKGQVDAENEQKYSQLKENLAKLQTTFGTLSEFLNQPLPTPEDENEEQTRLAGNTARKEEVVGNEGDDLLMLWEDAEQQRFYEEILDCKDVIPAVLLGLDKGASPAAAECDEAEEKPAKPEVAKGSKAEASKDDDGKTLGASDFDLYLMRVAQAEAAKQVDDLVQEFFHEHNTKGARRALAATLFDISRSSPSLVAPRARFVATVAPYLKEVPTYVLTGLQKELEQIVTEKDPERLEYKVKTVRYLCELCKFKICPPGVVLDSFKTLCDDFSQHHAELCAHILMCCGRFLLYSPQTTTRTENLLERMMRLKNSKSLRLELEIMLEDAYYTVKPPEGKRLKTKQKEPLQLFAQQLIYDRLYTEEDDDKVLRLVRKLPWDGPAPKWIKKCILELNLHANYENIAQLASLLSGLAKYRDWFVIDVIDSLFENIQTAIERNDFREAPLRVRQVKLLGELYNYRLIDSNIVFDMMYHLIGFGGPTMHRAGNIVTAHRVLERALAARRASLGSIQEESGGDDAYSQIPPVLADPQHPLEAAWDYFRIKLVCVLLETCGHYFDRGAVKQKLDRFLQFFMRYVLAKGELPLRMTYMVSDMLERLRPKLAIPTDLGDIDKQILKILRSERENLDLADKAEEKEDREEEEDDDDTTEEEDSSDDEGDSSSEGEESEEETEEEEEEEDLQDYNRGAEANKKQVEEVDEFDKEVQQMLIDSLEREKHAPRVLAELPAPPPASKRPEGMQEPGVFSLLQKKTGGKVLMKQIEIPEDSKLARVSQQGEQEASKEKEELKRYIIQYDQMSATTGAPPPPLGGLGVGGNSRGPVHVQLRAGKGGASKGSVGKGGKGGKSGGGLRFAPGGRKGNEDYLKDEFLPEDGKAPAAAAPPASSGGHGGARSGGGGSGYGAGGPGLRGKGSSSDAGASHGGGGKRGPGGGKGGGDFRKGDQSRGTPSQPMAKGSF